MLESEKSEEEGQVMLSLLNSCRVPDKKLPSLPWKMLWPWLCLLAECTAKQEDSLNPSSNNPLPFSTGSLGISPEILQNASSLKCFSCQVHVSHLLSCPQGPLHSGTVALRGPRPSPLSSSMKARWLTKWPYWDFALFLNFLEDERNWPFSLFLSFW